MKQLGNLSAAGGTMSARLTDKQVRAQIYGVLASKLRMACVVDGNDVDVERYHAMQIKIAEQIEKRHCQRPEGE